MSTSLAEQLQRLALPQTDTLKRDKKRDSLLFHPKEAAALRKETFYQIGVEGLEELIAKNPIFDSFKNTLFNITSQDIERAVLTKEANTKLNKNIRRFILLLSPYFLLNFTHKALEWLIHRYNVHKYNRDDLLMLALPYHESNIFVRIIQLMKFREHSDIFYFLKSLQKTGVHLTKESLLTKAASDVQFLQFVTRFLKEIIEVHDNKGAIPSTAFNFYTTVFVGAIEYSKEVSEAQVTQIIPSVINGLNSKIPDYVASSYVITARLVAKAPLKEEVLEKIVEKVCELSVERLKVEAILLLLVIYQSQNYSEMSEGAFLKLVERTDIAEIAQIIERLNSEGSYVYPLLEQIIKVNYKVALKMDLEDYRNRLDEVLSVVRFDDYFVPQVLRIFLDGVRIKKKFPPHVDEWKTKLLTTIERKYPEAFDKEIYNILSSTPTQEGVENERKKSLQKILDDSMILKDKFEVFDKLYHPNAQIRINAIKFLGNNYESLRDKEKIMIKNSFIDRLNDDSIEVIKDALVAIKKTKILDGDILKDNLITLSWKCQRDLKTYKQIRFRIAELLALNSAPNDWDCFLALFPNLLPTSNADIPKLERICQTPCLQNNLLLKPKIRDLLEINDARKFCETVFDSLGQNSDLELVDDFIRVLQKTPCEKRDVLHKYLATLVLSCIIPQNSPIEVTSSVIDIFVAYFDSSVTSLEKTDGDFLHHLKVAKKGQFSVEGFVLGLKHVITKTQKPSIDLEIFDFSQQNPISHFFTTLANILSRNSAEYKNCLKVFLDYFCETPRNKLGFLLNLGACGSKNYDENFVQSCAENISDLLKANNKIHVDEIVLIYIFVLLLNKSDKVRTIVMQIIEILSGKNEKLQFLLDGILKQREEIILDEEQTPLILFNLLVTKTEITLSFIKLLNKNYPSYIKSGILVLFSHINNVEIFEEVAKLTLNLMEPSANRNDSEAAIIQKSILRFEINIAPDIKVGSFVAKLGVAALKNDRTDDRQICPAVLLLNQLDKEMFKNLNETIREQFLDVIIETVTLTKNPEILPAASKFFKHIELDANLILPHLKNMRDVQSPKLDQNKSKRKRLVVPTIDIIDTLLWRKGVTVLEFIQDKKKILNPDILLGVLFEILKKCLDFDEQAAVEYPKQLVLTTILQICSKLDKSLLPEKVFNVELIVQCIRASPNPQTHHHALLVLAHSAALIPTQVLHHIMAIFTFMGSSVLRHDDAYSFQIISKIIDTIIPILIEENNVKTIVQVLRVFVDVIRDVPEHRRLPLYKQLLNKIGPNDNLHLFLLLIFESHVVHNEKRKDGAITRLDIATDICCALKPQFVVTSCIKLMKYLKDLPDDQPANAKLQADCYTFDIARHTPKQFRHYKYTIITFIANLLSSRDFINLIASLEDDDIFDMESLYKDMILNILMYLQRLSKVSERNANTPQAQYWKVLLHHSYDILDSLNALLTPQMFLLVIKGLMAHSLSSVKRRALELLNSKLQHNSSFFQDCEKAALYSLVPPLISIVETVDKTTLDSDQELIVQTALLSLKLLVKHLAKDYKDTFVEILEFISNLIKSGKVQNNVLASMVLCLAELCICLRVDAITILPNFMPTITKILKQQKRQETPSLLVLSTLTAVQKILDTLPLFLSPYLEKLLVEVCSLSCKWPNDDSAIINKLTTIRQKLGTLIPARVLIPIIEQTYKSLINKNNFAAIAPLMEILGWSLKNIKGSELNANLQDLTNFFLNALLFRSDSGASVEDMTVVEGHVIKALTVLILKLSESNFRPLYYKLFDWAVRGEIKNDRIITFYALSSEIADSLKSLFVLFAGHFLNNASQLLDHCNRFKSDTLYFNDENKNILLLENVLRTLLMVFTYDNQKFVNKDRFGVLMQPLVDQLENTLGGLEAFAKRSTDLLTPCVVQFAVATGDDALWKQMNYQILLKMRHTTPQIRLAALICLTEIVKKLGEDFLPLLPETIPFLAELLEDEEESVENACRKAVQEMEKVLGENLQKYF